MDHKYAFFFACACFGLYSCLHEDEFMNATDRHSSLYINLYRKLVYSVSANATYVQKARHTSLTTR